jgi:hypothetical protein
MELIVWD